MERLSLLFLLVLGAYSNFFFLNFAFYQKRLAVLRVSSVGHVCHHDYFWTGCCFKVFSAEVTDYFAIYLIPGYNSQICFFSRFSNSHLIHDVEDM